MVHYSKQSPSDNPHTSRLKKLALDNGLIYVVITKLLMTFSKLWNAKTNNLPH